jgi:hypothetical protein
LSHLTVRLTWDIPDDDGGSPIAFYNVSVYADPTHQYAKTALIRGLTGLINAAVFSNLQPSSWYLVTVAAVNSFGNGAESVVLSFQTESQCLSRDGIECSGRGRCIGGQCQCDAQYTGSRCELTLKASVCAIWAGGNVLSFSGANSRIASRTVGMHTLMRSQPLARQERTVEVQGKLRPFDPIFSNMTVLEQINVIANNDRANALVVQVSKQSVVDFHVGCNGESLSQRIADAEVQGYSAPLTPFIIRRDALNRWIIRISGSRARVIVQPWAANGNAFLSVFMTVVSDKIDDSFQIVGEQLTSLSGICADISSEGDINPLVIDQNRCALQQTCGTLSTASVPFQLKVSTSTTPTSANNPIVANNDILSLLELEESFNNRGMQDLASVRRAEYSHNSDSAFSLQPMVPSAHRLVFATMAIMQSVSDACASPQAAATASSQCKDSANTDAFTPCVRDVCLMPQAAMGLAAVHADAAVTLTVVRRQLDSQVDTTTTASGMDPQSYPMCPP